MSLLEATITFILVVAVYSLFAKLLFGEAVVDKIWQAIFSGNGKRGLFSYIVGFVWWFLTLPFRMLGFLFGHWRKTSGNYGSARFMNRRERRQTLSSKFDGFVIDGMNRLTRSQSFMHVVALGGSGKGKSQTLVLPSLFQFLGEQQSSLIVVDPARELMTLSSGYAKQCGYHVKVMDFGRPRRSHRANPFWRLTTESELYDIAQDLIQNGLGADVSSEAAAFFNNQAKTALYVLLKVLKRHDPTLCNPANLLRLLQMLAVQKQQKAVATFVYDHCNHDNPDDLTWGEFSALLANSEKTLQNILSTAQAALSVFLSPDWRSFSAWDDIDVSRLRREPTIVYVVLPEGQKSKRARFLVTLFFRQVFDEITQMPEGTETLDLWLLLDEFNNVGKLSEDFAELAGSERKRRVGMMLLLQSRHMLEALYGRDKAASILTNMGTHIIFRGQHHEVTADYAKAIGNTTIRAQESGFKKLADPSEPVRERELGKPLISTDELRVMNGRDDQALLFIPDKYPHWLTMRPAYKSRKYASLMRISPVAPPDHREEPVRYVQIPKADLPGARTREEVPDSLPLASPFQSAPVSLGKT